MCIPVQLMLFLTNPLKLRIKTLNTILIVSFQIFRDGPKLFNVCDFSDTSGPDYTFQVIMVESLGPTQLQMSLDL